MNDKQFAELAIVIVPLIIIPMIALYRDAWGFIKSTKEDDSDL